MKTLNIAPTWAWVVSMTLKLIEDGNQSKAEAGFVAECERLGPDVKLLIEEFRAFPSLRKKGRKLLMEKAVRVDEANAKKENQS